MDNQHKSHKEQSDRGRAGHFMGALVGALLGKRLGAERPERFANHYLLDGVPFQIRTISGSQSTFTVNPETEPERIIVAAKRDRYTTEELIGYAIFGILKSDALLTGKRSGSRGHARSEHLQVSLNVVKRVALGRTIISRKLVTATDQDERYELLRAIDDAPEGEPADVMDHNVVESIRAFILETASGKGGI